jgi:hypothetical protein
MSTYADAARTSSIMSPSDMENWCASHDVSADEALRIWTQAAGNADDAERIWADECGWTDETHDIRQFVAASGLTPTEVSRVLGRDDRTMRRWLSGEQDVPDTLAQQVARLRVTAVDPAGVHLTYSRKVGY